MRQRQAICFKSLCWQCKSSRAPAGTRASWDRWIVVASFPFTYTLGLSSDQVSNLHIVITIIVTIQRVVGSCSRLQSWHSTYCSSGIVVLHTYIHIYIQINIYHIIMSRRAPNHKTRWFLKNNSEIFERTNPKRQNEELFEKSLGKAPKVISFALMTNTNNKRESIEPDSLIINAFLRMGLGCIHGGLQVLIWYVIR